MKKRTKKKDLAGFLIIIFVLMALSGITFAVFQRYIVSKNKSILRHVSDHAEVSDERPEPLLDEDVIDAQIKEQLDKAKEEKSLKKKKDEEKKTVSVDLIVFAGQSNMAGWGGDAAKAPSLTEGAGAEFRAVSDPTKLYTITEPFGFYENTTTMNDMFLKRGSLVTSFVNAYYKETGVPVIAVSASKGGTPSTYWATEVVAEDVITRYINAKEWLNNNGYSIRNQFMVFLQGENDVLENVSNDQYLADINTFASKVMYRGIDKFMMIRIGRTIGDADAYDRIIKLQTELCRTDPRFVMISMMLSKLDTDMMVDDYHYGQEALNEVGADAGENAAHFAETRHDPVLTDYRTGEIYEPIQYEGL